MYVCVYVCHLIQQFHNKEISAKKLNERDD